LILKIGQAVTISVNVANTGESGGSYTVVLKVNGVVEDTRLISLGGGQTIEIVFSTVKSEEGNYTVEVNGQVATFSVVQPTQLILIIEVIGGVIVLGLIIWFIRRLYFLKTGY